MPAPSGVRCRRSMPESRVENHQCVTDVLLKFTLRGSDNLYYFSLIALVIVLNIGSLVRCVCCEKDLSR
jgi:hypothetical protein